MKESDDKITIEVESTKSRCPVGDRVATDSAKAGRTPVLSCEGGCIRGEIARLAANMVAKEPGFSRGCHGELLTVPQSEMSSWMRKAERVVLIDGCFLRCHGRILEGVLGKDRLLQFDALKHYKKYTDVFDIDDVPEEERKLVARDVADWVLRSVNETRADDCGVESNACPECQAV